MKFELFVSDAGVDYKLFTNVLTSKLWTISIFINFLPPIHEYLNDTWLSTAVTLCPHLRLSPLFIKEYFCRLCLLKTASERNAKIQKCQFLEIAFLLTCSNWNLYRLIDNIDTFTTLLLKRSTNFFIYERENYLPACFLRNIFALLSSVSQAFNNMMFACLIRRYKFSTNFQKELKKPKNKTSYKFFTTFNFLLFAFCIHILSTTFF